MQSRNSVAEILPPASLSNAVNSEPPSSLVDHGDDAAATMSSRSCFFVS
jgi:hypothetical protein